MRLIHWCIGIKHWLGRSSVDHKGRALGLARELGGSGNSLGGLDGVGRNGTSIGNFLCWEHWIFEIKLYNEEDSSNLF